MLPEPILLMRKVIGVIRQPPSRGRIRIIEN